MELKLGRVAQSNRRSGALKKLSLTIVCEQETVHQNRSTGLIAAMSSDDFSPLEDLDLGATVRGLRAGQKLLNRYTLKRILGRGGMGVVWLAYDESLEREIAFKFLPETVTHDRSAVDEIKRETKQSLELTHPNIVRIYDFVHDEQAAGLSMEYIDGDTLSNLRADQPNKCFDVVDLELWIRQLCSALESAHEDAELAHRDLKPANLMIDKRGRLKIADFGISRSVSDTVARVTMHSGASGTLVYMSPQQAMGEPASILDDIYSLGATLFELLTSKPPFYQGELMTQVREKVPPSMTQRRKDLGISGKPIPRRWEDTVAACLAKDPARRPQSCREVMQLLGVSDTKRIPRPRAKSGEGKKTRTSRSKTASPRTETPSVTSETPPPPAYGYDLAAETPRPKSKTQPPKSEPEKVAAKTTPPSPPVPLVPLPVATPPSPPPPAPLPAPAKAVPPSPPTVAVVPVTPAQSQRLTHLVILLLLLVAAGWYYVTRPPEDPEHPVLPVKLTQAELDAAIKDREAQKATEALKVAEAKHEQLTAEMKKQKEEASKRAVDAEKARAAAENKTKQLSDEAEKKRIVAEQQSTEATLKAKREADAELKAQAETARREKEALEKERMEDAKKAAELAAMLEEKKLETKRLREEAMEKERIANLRGGVVVKTVPEEAKVNLGNKSLAGKAALFAGLREGEYPVEIQLDGYETTNIVALVQDNPKTTKVASTNVYSVSLMRSTGTLKLASTPEKARYSLTMSGPQKLIGPQDAVRSGQTPAMVKLPTGTYKLELRKNRWVVNREFTVVRNQSIDVALDLPFGSLKLESDPPGATVIHKGKEIGKTPLDEPEFDLGDAVFEIKKNLYRPVTTNLVVKPQQLAGLKVKLALRLGPGYRQVWTNSLGMKFVPLGDGKKLICIWETRKRDYDEFVRLGPRVPGDSRKEPDFKQTSGHPVVNVNWPEARAFCAWLTDHERNTGWIENQSYRLPTDAEWSEAAGMSQEAGRTPFERHVQRRGEYPWGSAWPPGAGAGNYDEEFGCDRTEKTAIVGQFKPNSGGLFDLGGNVWEWCDDWFDGGQKERAARGGSWRSTWRDASADVLLSSYRLHLPPAAREPDVGFRCVLEIGVLE